MILICNKEQKRIFNLKYSMARLKKLITNRGFLPETTPLRVVQNKTTSTDVIGNVALELPKLLLTNQIRPTIDKIKNLDLHLDDHSLGEQELLFAQLSFIAHAYVWGDLKPVQNLPKTLVHLGLSFQKI